MADTNVLSDVVTFALGGGLAAVIAAGIKAYTSIRSGIRAGERETIDNIVADRQRARDEADAARTAAHTEVATIRKDLRYYEWVTHQYQWQLMQAGIRPIPENPVVPSERNGTGGQPGPPPVGP